MSGPGTSLISQLGFEAEDMPIAGAGAAPTADGHFISESMMMGRYYELLAERERKPFVKE